MLLRAPTKVALTLLYLLLLTACGGAVEQPAAPPVATPTPQPSPPTAGPSSTPTRPATTPRPAPTGWAATVTRPKQ